MSWKKNRKEASTRRTGAGRRSGSFPGHRRQRTRRAACSGHRGVSLADVKAALRWRASSHRFVLTSSGLRLATCRMCASTCRSWTELLGRAAHSYLRGPRQAVRQVAALAAGRLHRRTRGSGTQDQRPAGGHADAPAGRPRRDDGDGACGGGGRDGRGRDRGQMRDIYGRLRGLDDGLPPIERTPLLAPYFYLRS